VAANPGPCFLCVPTDLVQHLWALETLIVVELPALGYMNGMPRRRAALNTVVGSSAGRRFPLTSFAALWPHRWLQTSPGGCWPAADQAANPRHGPSPWFVSGPRWAFKIAAVPDFTSGTPPDVYEGSPTAGGRVSFRWASKTARLCLAPTFAWSVVSTALMPSGRCCSTVLATSANHWAMCGAG